MKRILVVEDDPAILTGLVASLEVEHYKVLTASDGAVGYEMGKQKDLDLIILDLMLPSKDGQEICRDLRKDGVGTPIIMLTSRKEETDKVLGLEHGADDYVTKPFSVRELHARIKVLLKRRGEYNEAAERATRLSRDLERARNVQQNLFPTTLPEQDGWEFAGFCRPALAVGGDYYDLFKSAPHHLVAALGDVSGKGLGSALHMAGVHSAIRSGATEIVQKPDEFIQGLNRYLLSATSSDMFVTLFVSSLDLSTGQVQYINCGHPDPVVFRQKTGTCSRLSQRGLILGVFPDSRYTVGHILLEAGDFLVAFSDGVTEAMNAENEQYGEEKLLKTIHESYFEHAPAIIDRITRSVEMFSAGHEQSDDISVIAMRRTGVRSDKPPLANIF